jgi:hypothetical protein
MVGFVLTLVFAQIGQQWRKYPQQLALLRFAALCVLAEIFATISYAHAHFTAQHFAVKPALEEQLEAVMATHAQGGEV